MTQKIQTKKPIGESQTFDAEYDSTHETFIDEVIDWLTDAKSKGATQIQWVARTDSDGSSETVEAQAFSIEEESDEEYQIRKQKNEDNRRSAEEWKLKLERQQYEELKKKFEI
jgi:hypothetical protein